MSGEGSIHTVDLLEEALSLATHFGFEVRREWLSGRKGGACRLGQKHLLFVDLSLSAAEQLEQVIGPLRSVVDRAASLSISPRLQRLLPNVSVTESNIE